MESLSRELKDYLIKSNRLISLKSVDEVGNEKWFYGSLSDIFFDRIILYDLIGKKVSIERSLIRDSIRVYDESIKITLEEKVIDLHFLEMGLSYLLTGEQEFMLYRYYNSFTIDKVEGITLVADDSSGDCIKDGIIVKLYSGSRLEKEVILGEYCCYIKRNKVGQIWGKRRSNELGTIDKLFSYNGKTYGRLRLDTVQYLKKKTLINKFFENVVNVLGINEASFSSSIHKYGIRYGDFLYKSNISEYKANYEKEKIRSLVARSSNGNARIIDIPVLESLLAKEDFKEYIIEGYRAPKRSFDNKSSNRLLVEDNDSTEKVDLKDFKVLSGFKDIIFNKWYLLRDDVYVFFEKPETDKHLKGNVLFISSVKSVRGAILYYVVGLKSLGKTKNFIELSGINTSIADKYLYKSRNLDDCRKYVKRVIDQGLLYNSRTDIPLFELEVRDDIWYIVGIKDEFSKLIIEVNTANQEGLLSKALSYKIVYDKDKKNFIYAKIPIGWEYKELVQVLKRVAEEYKGYGLLQSLSHRYIVYHRKGENIVINKESKVMAVLGSLDGCKEFFKKSKSGEYLVVEYTDETICEQYLVEKIGSKFSMISTKNGKNIVDGID